MTTGVRIRPMNELDIEGICRIDEKITGRYRPEVWEQRAAYYIRRDPDSSQVAEVDGRVVGFMLGEVRGGEFGLEEPTGWVEFFGVDPSSREKGVVALIMYFANPMEGARLTARRCALTTSSISTRR